MLNIKPPNFQYCPFCGKKLEIRIEEDRERMFCPDDNWTYYPHVGSSAGVVIVRNNKVLLVQRNREPYKGLWMFPAGFTSYGEHPEETALREAFEETGLKTSNPKLIDIGQVDDDPRSDGHFSIFYKVDAEDGEISTDLEENQSIQWFDINNLPQIAWKHHNKIAKLLQEGKLI